MAVEDPRQSAPYLLRNLLEEKSQKAGGLHMRPDGSKDPDTGAMFACIHNFALCTLSSERFLFYKPCLFLHVVVITLGQSWPLLSAFTLEWYPSSRLNTAIVAIWCDDVADDAASPGLSEKNADRAVGF